MGHTPEEWPGLCQRTKDLVPVEIGHNAWSLVIAATLATSPDTSALGSFYTYLITHDDAFSSKKAKEHLSLRLRDVLFKLVPLVGGPQVLSVLMPLAKAEGDVERKSEESKLSNKWQADKLDVPAIYNRGEKVMNSVYGPSLLPKVFASFGSHKEDIVFTEIFTFYGLYLSDFEVMTPLETEAVVYSTISCLGLGGPRNWHLRGMGRLLGARGADNMTARNQSVTTQVNNLRQAVMTVVEFVGDEFVCRAKLEKWANVEDMLESFGGWGDDEVVSLS